MFTEKDNQLQASFQFKDFKAAFGFMMQVAFLAEQHNHHPNWSNVWNQVDIQLCTHDAGNIVTEKDRALAKDIEELAQHYSQSE